MALRLPACLIVASLIVTALCGCAREDAESTLRRGNGGEPGSLDPALAEDVHAFRILVDLYEGLVIADTNGDIAPGVASDWTISNDGRTYTFRLREDAVWSNGDPVTAQQFAASFRRTLAPDFGSAYSFLLHPIRNATAVVGGELTLDALGVQAQDDHTLIIHLDAPTAHFASVLAMPIAFPLPPKGNYGTDSATFVGNGAYVLSDRQPGHRIRLDKNARFHDADSVAIEAVEYYAVSDLLSEYNMYRAGELDFTASVPDGQVKTLLTSRSSELRVAPKLGLYYLAFDLSEAPFTDVNLRQALSMAIDREALVEIIGRGEQAAYGVVPDGTLGYQPVRYDWRALGKANRENEARRALAASDYDASLSFTLTYDTDDIHEKIALAISSMWRDVLGINAQLDKREWQYFLETRNRRAEWDMMRFAWIGDYNHASTFTDLFHSQSPQNLPGYRSEEYDGHLAAADELAQAEATLLADYPIAPLYFYVSKHLVSPRVRGFENNVLDQHPSRFLRLEPLPKTP